jgi:hypothetical protein
MPTSLVEILSIFHSLQALLPNTLPLYDSSQILVLQVLCIAESLPPCALVR